MSESGIEIRPVDDAAAAMELGRAAGLEDAEGDTEGLLVRWGAYEGDRLLGTVALRHWQGMYIVGWMAVAEERRGAGVGTALLRVLEREAIARGAERLWVTARAPGFYLQAGFAPVERGPQRDALLGPCLDCRQFGTTCHPIAAVKVLKGAPAGVTDHTIADETTSTGADR